MNGVRNPCTRRVDAFLRNARPPWRGPCSVVLRLLRSEAPAFGLNSTLLLMNVGGVPSGVPSPRGKAFPN